MLRLLLDLWRLLTGPPGEGPFPGAGRQGASPADLALGLAQAEPRDGRWPRVRAEWLKAHPVCEVCGRPGGELTVHHVWPVHFPGGRERELDPTNFATVHAGWEHLAAGHGFDWRARNPNFKGDASRLGLLFMAIRAAREYPKET